MSDWREVERHHERGDHEDAAERESLWALLLVTDRQVDRLAELVRKETQAMGGRRR